MTTRKHQDPQKVAPVKEPPAPEKFGDEPQAEHEGATGNEVGDRTGPGAGFDDEPGKVKDKGGVASS